MTTQLIELNDGLLVEVLLEKDLIEPIAGGESKEIVKVDSSIDQVQGILLKASKPVLAVWEELNRDLIIEKAEIELGLGFEAEGNLFIAKGKGNANLTVKLILKPKL